MPPFSVSIGGLDIEKQKRLLQTALINNWKNVYSKDEEPSNNEILNELEKFYKG